MSFLDDFDSHEVTDFTGPTLIQDEEDIRDPRGLAAADVEYTARGLVKTRNGFAPVWTATGPIKSLYNWLQSITNRLIYFQTSGASGNVVSRNIRDNSEITVLSGITALGFSLAESGYRLILTFFKADVQPQLPTGATEGRIWDGSWTSGPPLTANVEKLFPRALLKSEVTLSFTEPGAGNVTAGKHYFGVAVTSYSGGQTPLGPTAADLPWASATADSFTASGNKSISVTLHPTTTWPMWVYSVQIAMTDIVNPDRPYLIPGAVAGVPRGSSVNVTINFNIADEALADTGEDVVDSGRFALFTQNSAGNGPINPYKVIAFNERTVFLADIFSPDLFSSYTAILISEQNNPHWITANNHQRNLPEYRKACSGGVISSVLYIAGPNWTYGFSDNTRLPSQWAVPRTVSPNIGTSFINGICQGNGYLWVAHSSGLYKFDGGLYPLKPTSYEQTPDWEKINFMAPPGALRVLENPDRRMVYVIAPVNLAPGDNQAVANRILVWDYSSGTTSDKVQYCGMYAIQAGAYPIGDGCIVHSPQYTIQELWLGRATAGNVLRQKSIPADSAVEVAGLYDDDATGIASRYRFGPLVGVNVAPSDYHGANIRVRGNGTLKHRVYSLDASNARPLTDITADMSPSKRYTRLFDKQNESCSYEIDNNSTPGAFFILAAVRTYFSKWLSMR
jgi:hypothetical protein